MPFAEGRDRQRIGAEIDAFNAAGREEARDAGAGYAEITAISRSAGPQPGMAADDGLHPSPAQHALWAEAIAPMAKAALAAP